MKTKKLLAMLSAITMMLSASAGYLPALPKNNTIRADAADTAASRAQSVKVQEESKTDASGLTYTEGEDGVTITGYQGKETALVLPAKIGELPVTAIGAHAFKDNAKLTAITFPETLKAIHDSAFEECTRLTAVDIPASVTAIGANAFKNCTKLASILLHEGLEHLDECSFEATPITEIYIPASLKQVDYSYYGTFVNCEKLSTVTFGAGMEKIPDGLFRNCPGLRAITLPDGLLSTGEYVFLGCANLASVTLPDSLERIGKGAFRNSKLSAITFPAKLEAIEDSAFEGCERLTEIDIPESVLSVGANAFKDCSRLAKIQLHEGLEHLDECSFEATPITEIYIPASLKQVDYSYYGTFVNCEKLSTVTFGAGIEKIPDSLFRNCPGLKEITLPDGLLSTGEYTFFGCANLASVTLPDSLETISKGAFSNTKLSAITLPANLEAIEDNAFEGCERLTEIDIPASVLSIGEYAFKGCIRLAKIQLHEGLEHLDECSFEATPITEIYIPASLKQVDYSYYGTFVNCEKLSTVTFGAGIEKIPDSLFRNCPGLKEITLPDGLLSTGEYTFFGCANLASVTLPDSLVKINKGAFRKTKLSAITLPASLEAIEDSAFEECERLTAIDIPGSVLSIGEYAFKNCKRLAAVQLHEGLEHLDECSFEATAITEIYIPSTLRQVDYSYYGTFCNCAKLTHAVIADGMEKVPDSLFRNAPALTAVTVPKSVEKFGDYLFLNCKKLVRIHAEQDTISFLPHTFEGCDSFTDNRFTLLDTEKTGISSNSNLTAVNGTVNYTLRYKFRDNIADDVSNLKLNLRIPEGITVLADSVSSSDPSADYSKITDGTVKLTDPEGILYFSARIVENGNYTIGASMEFTYNKSDWSHNIGSMKVDVPAVMVNTAAITNTLTANVFGIANRGADVEIFVNDKSVGSVKANAYTGKYSTNVALPEGASGTEYKIYAKSGEAVSETVTTTYQAEKPAVQKVVMYYNNHMDSSLDITNVLTEGVSPVISFNPAYPLRFAVTVSNPERVQRLFITSDKGDVMKYLEATYDASTQLWTAEGYFDPSNHSYVPGALNISIIEKPLDHADEDTFDFTAADTMPAPQEVLNNSSVEVLEETDHSIYANITVSNGTTSGTYQHYSENADGVTINGTYVTAEEIAKAPEKYGYVKVNFTSTSGNDNYSYYIRTINADDVNKDVALKIKNLASNVNGFLSGTSILKKLEGEAAENELMKPLFSLGNNYVTGEFKEILKNKSEELFGSNLYGDITKGISIVGTTAGMIYDMQRAEDNPDLQAAILTMYAIKMFRTLGGEKALMTAAGIAPPASIVLGIAIGMALDLVGEYLEECIQQNKEFTLSGFLRFIIDPSGYVFEAVPGNLVEGATVTVYYQDKDTGEAVKWNAEDYDQMNPLLTDAEGKYVWDVPEGLWKVVCEKDGYEKTETDWMIIPPPRTDVNISIVSKEAPKLVSAEQNGNTITVKLSKFAAVSSVTAASFKLDGFTGTFTVTPKLLSETDAYADTFILSGEFGNSVTSVTVLDTVSSYAGVAAEKSVVTLKTILRGDVNGDGSVNLKDVVMIRRFIAGGWNAELDTAIADVNGDGTVNLKDVVMIRRFIAGGWNVTL